MNSNYDVLIAGAGPSGISCGITLQKQGVKCCIIDKAKFPREKLCGGLLTNKAYNKILELTDGNTDIVDAATLQVVSRVSIARNILILNSSNVDIPIRIIDRTILDGELVSYYKIIGGIIKEEAALPLFYFVAFDFFLMLAISLIRSADLSQPRQGSVIDLP